MSDQPSTKPLTFTHQMWKFVGVFSYVEKLSANEEFNETIFQMRSQDYDSFLNDLSTSFKFSMSEREMGTMKRELQDGMEKRWRKAVEDFLPILLNQGLVISCSIFDSFLIDCIDVLAPFAALCFATQKDLDDELELEDSGVDVDQIYRRTEERILERFDRRGRGIEERVSWMKRLGVDFDAALSLRFRIYQKSPGETAANNYDSLLTIYKNRNDVVHRGQLPLKAYQDLH